MYLCRNHSLADGTCELVHFAAEMKSKMKEDWLGVKFFVVCWFSQVHFFKKRGLHCQREDVLGKCQAGFLGETEEFGENGANPLVIWSPVNGLWYVVSLAAGLLVMAMGILVFWKWKHHAREDDVPEEIPMQPLRKPRGPKKFTLE